MTVEHEPDRRPGGLEGRLHVALAISKLDGLPGGAERVLVDVANGLYRRGHRVTILTDAAPGGAPFYPLDDGVERRDGRPAASETAGTDAPPARTRTARRTAGVAARDRRLLSAPLWLVQYGPRMRRVRRLLREVRPDVAVGFMPSMFPYLGLVGPTTGTPVVASLHNVPDRELGGDPTRWDQNPVDVRIRRRSLRRAVAVTVPVAAFLDELEPAVRSHTHVVPNMVDGFGERTADVSKGPDNRILAVGRLNYAKDHATLVAAWAQLEADHPDWRVEIVGTGPLADPITRQIEDLGLHRIAVQEPDARIEQRYLGSKILAVPSAHEGFGLVTAEAMACGLPAVGFSDCAGTNEVIIDDHNGVLVDPADDRPTALANGLRRLMDDESLRVRLGADAPATIASRYDRDTVIDAWERVLFAASGH